MDHHRRYDSKLVIGLPVDFNELSFLSVLYLPIYVLICRFGCDCSFLFDQGFLGFSEISVGFMVLGTN